MSSAFDALWAGLQPVFDAQWGEPVRLIPQINDDSSEYVERGASSSIPARDMTGIFELTSVVDRFLGTGNNSRDTTDVAADQSTIDFDDALFIAAPPPAKGDILVLTARPRMPSYKVVTCEHNNAARWVAKIVFDRNTA